MLHQILYNESTFVSGCWYKLIAFSNLSTMYAVFHKNQATLRVATIWDICTAFISKIKEFIEYMGCLLQTDSNSLFDIKVIPAKVGFISRLGEIINGLGATIWLLSQAQHAIVSMNR